MIGPITNPRWQAWAAKALAEDRLHWRVTDAQGRPCNGGSADPLPLGRWSPTISGAEICVRGWHTTSDPLRWRGVRVWLVEGEGLVGEEDDKRCWRRIRPLAEVDPRNAINDRCRVAAMRANLSWANLARANLARANLSGANLTRANLSGANLTRANLSWANLTRANLSWANLTRANLSWANLTGANLSGANLTGANLSGANLGRWERGPDGYARRLA